MNPNQTIPEINAENNLFPVFIKLEQLRLLIIGGGNVGLEKLNAVLQNSPATKIRLVATAINETIKDLSLNHPGIELFERPYVPDDLDKADIVIVAINDKATSSVIGIEAKARGKLINVADTPELCDFYLSSIVKKGNLKIAISTNGKSPTIAKRMKEQLNELIPDEIEGVLQNMHTIRQDLKGDFAEKVKQLDDLTKVLSAKQTKLEQINKPGARKWQGIVKWCLFAFFFYAVRAPDPFLSSPS